MAVAAGAVDGERAGARRATRGLSVASSDAFRAGVDAPNAIRVSLGAEADRAQLEQALGTLAGLMRSRPQPPRVAVVLSCAATAVLTAPRRSFEPRGAGQDGDDSRRAGHDSRRSQFTCR